ncbi:MAG: ATP-binding protein [Lachnospiraceae bacterium]|nr:ATP-binding protein [Lachnospiraceae bacterium]
MSACGKKWRILCLCGCLALASLNLPGAEAYAKETPESGYEAALPGEDPDNAEDLGAGAGAEAEGTLGEAADPDEGAAEDTAGSVAGEAEDYEVLVLTSAEELLDFARSCREESWSRDKYVILDQDISLRGTAFPGIPSFSGIFNGGGHIVSGFAMEEERSYAGFFNTITEGALVMDLSLSGTVLTPDSRYATGGLTARNAGIVSGCSFSGLVVGGDCVGSIAGINEANGQLLDCVSEGAVKGRHQVGGIAGEQLGCIRSCENRSDINASYAELALSLADLGSISIPDSLTELFAEREDRAESALRDLSDTGGIAGHNSGVIMEARNTGTVGYEHVGENIGGIAGRQSGYLLGCENTGAVYGQSGVGGIAGRGEPYSVILADLDTLEELRESIRELHDLIDRTLRDAGTASDVLSNRLTVMQRCTAGALDDLDYLGGTTVAYVTKAVDTVNAAYSRMHTLMQQLKAVTDALSDSGRIPDSPADVVAEAAGRLPTDRPGPAVPADPSELTLPSVDIDPSSVELPSVDIDPSSVDLPSVDIDPSAIRQLSVGTISIPAEVLKFPAVAKDYGAHVNSLNANLKAMNDHYGLLIAELNSQTHVLLGDLRAVNDQTQRVLELFAQLVEEAAQKKLSDYIRDESVEVGETSVDSTIDSCSNSGEVSGDENCGGILGLLSPETDAELSQAEETLEEAKKLLVGSCVIGSVVRGCENRGSVRGTKDHVGGICGFQTMGVIRDSSSIAEISTGGGSYVGGIAGRSDGHIQRCTSRGKLSGAEYVGGIVGDGAALADCLSMVSIPEARDWFGAVAGHLTSDAEISGCYFISEELAGINRVSSEGRAEQTTLRAASSLQNILLPADFDSMRITFVLEEDGEETEVGETTVLYNGQLTEAEYPTVQAPEGYYLQWETTARDGVREDLRILGHFLKLRSTIAGAELLESGQSKVLVDGSFRESDALEVLPGDLPRGGSGSEYILDAFSLTIPEDGAEAHTVRYYVPEEVTSPAASLVPWYAEQGTWKRASGVREMGRYLLFEVPGNEPTVKLVWNRYRQFFLTHTVLPMVLVALAALILLTLLTVALVKHKRIGESGRIVYLFLKKKLRNVGTDDLFYHAKENREGEESEGIRWQEIAEEWGLAPGEIKPLELKTDLGELDRIIDAVEALPADESAVSKASLVSEEMFVNIVSYANAEYVRYYCCRAGNDIVIAFWDNGRGFDPTRDHKEEAADTLLVDLEMGIGLIKKATAQWIYTRRDRENCSFMRVTPS